MDPSAIGRALPASADAQKWVYWKRHLMVCADCTAGEVCEHGRGLLGADEPDDAPWLRTSPRPAAVAEADVPSTYDLRAALQAGADALAVSAERARVAGNRGFAASEMRHATILSTHSDALLLLAPAPRDPARPAWRYPVLSAEEAAAEVARRATEGDR